MMTLTQPFTNVYLLSCENKQSLAEVMMRMQEHYESPFPEIVGQYVDRDLYESLYIERISKPLYDKNYCTYAEDWGGFNVPSHAVRSFYELHDEYDLDCMEYSLKHMLEDALSGDDKFYLIAIHEDQPIDFKSTTYLHELAHAFYYLDPIYKSHMDSLVGELPKRMYAGLKKELLRDGYTEGVVDDEIQAYLSTDRLSDLDSWEYSYVISLKHYAKFQRKYDSYIDVLHLNNGDIGNG